MRQQHGGAADGWMPPLARSSCSMSGASNHGRNGGGVRKGRNGGAKKQPQRGLGVAQLEKLRLQEQQQCKQQDHPCYAFSPPDQVLQSQDRSIAGALGLGLIPMMRQSQQWPMLPMLPRQQQSALQQGHRAMLSQLSSGFSGQEKENLASSKAAAAAAAAAHIVVSGAPSSLCLDKMTQDHQHAPVSAAAAAAVAAASINPPLEGPRQAAYPLPPPSTPSVSSASRPPDHQQHQVEFAVLGTPPLHRKPHKLPSLQIDQHQHWTPSDEKMRKRPRLELWLRPKNALPMPRPDGSERQRCGNALGRLSPQVEKPVMLTTWLEKDDYQIDKTLAGTSLNDSATRTPSATVINNSCSTVSSSPIVTPNSETVREVEIESTPLSEFLTLGLTSPSREFQAMAHEKNGDNDTHRQTPMSQQKEPWINWIRIGSKTADGYTDGVSLDLNLRLSL